MNFKKIWNRFWNDFELISKRFWTNLELILNKFQFDLELIWNIELILNSLELNWNLKDFELIRNQKRLKSILNKVELFEIEIF